MTKKIEKLNREQIDRIYEVREEWLNIGLSTGLSDRVRVGGLVDEVYRNVGLEIPKIKIWLRSPFQGCMGSYILAQVRDQVWAQVWDQVGDQVWDQVGDQVLKCGYGIHDAGWLSFYSYFSRYIELKGIQPLIELSKEIGWWWPFRGAVILTERPVRIFRDEEKRLHNEDGKAVEYSDGFSVYAWHGVRVPRHVIEEPEGLTTEMVLKEGNQEVRRVILERYGYDRLLKELGANEESRDRFGRLYSMTRLGEYLDGEDEIAKFVIVKDSSTDREYVLRVDPSSRTAHEGIAGTFGRTTEQYNPIQEA